MDKAMSDASGAQHEFYLPRKTSLNSISYRHPFNPVGVFGYLCLCLHIFFFSSLLVAAPTTFQALTREDSWVENLTAVWFLLAGLLLFVTALVERSFFRRCVYILGGLAMVFAAGEEISWGQRLFGFATPDFLMPLNEQKEFTVHNIANKSFDIIWLNGTLLLCMATSAAFFCRKDRLFGIPLPSILLMLGFLIVLSYESGADLKELSGADLKELSGANFSEYLVGVKRSFGLIVIEEKGLLLLFLLFALFSGHVKLIVASAATLALVLALTYVNYHSNVNNSGGVYEVREYLFGLGCLFYSLELMLAQGRFTAISRAPFSGLKLRGRRIPFWLLTCSLVIAGSIGLMVFQYFNNMAKTAAIEEAYEEAYQSIVAGKPVVRASFDVYLIENELAYVKEPCAPADTEPRFFLHLIPAAANDLPAARKQYGFDNLDFHFDRDNSRRFGGKCLVTKPLPDYQITSIRTGQYIPGEGPLWQVEFPVGAGRGKAAARSALGRASGR